MHILITNDDGIHAIGIKVLADAALARGHKVLVAAPAQQCSANSQHITLSKPLLVNPVNWENVNAYSIEITAPCIKFESILKYLKLIGLKMNARGNSKIIY